MSLPKYLTLGSSKVLRGKMGSLPNMRKKEVIPLNVPFGMEIIGSTLCQRH